VSERHGHPSVLATNDLWTIVGHWPELVARVARGGAGQGEKVTSSRSASLPIDSYVVEVMAEIDAWAFFLARVLMDEVTVEVPVPGPVRGTWAEPWRPTDTSTAGLLRQIATERVGHFTEHSDEGLRLSFFDDAKRHADRAEKTARPSGRRKIRLGVRCIEHGTTELGERVPCRGQYATVLDPEARGMADMVCEADQSHRMTPLEWQRGLRRGLIDQATVDALVRESTRVGGSG
jgi:hypothetical protein